MNWGPRRVPLLTAVMGLIGAGALSIAAGWDRWSYCWDRGTYSCVEAQNDPPVAGVLSDWNESAISASWLLLGAAILALAVVGSRLSRGIAAVLAVEALGAAGSALVLRTDHDFGVGPWWVGVLEFTGTVGATGTLMLLAAIMVWLRLLGFERPPPGWMLFSAALAALAASATLVEFRVLLFDDSHDSPTGRGIYSGALYLVAACALLIAAARARRGPQKATQRMRSAMLCAHRRR